MSKHDDQINYLKERIDAARKDHDFACNYSPQLNKPFSHLSYDYLVSTVETLIEIVNYQANLLDLILYHTDGE